MEIVIGAVALGATFFIGFLAFWQGMPGQRAAKRELSKQRLLKIELNGSSADAILWVLPWADNTAYMVELDVTLTNMGGGSVEDVTIELDMASLIYVSDFDRQAGGAAKLAGLQRETDPVDGVERTKVFFKVPAIHPNVSVHIADSIFLPGTSRIQSEIDAVTKDGIPIRARYEFVYSWAIRLSAHGRDLQAAQGEWKIITLPPDDRFLAPLDDPERGLARLAEALKRPDRPPPAPALILRPTSDEAAPEEVRQALGVPTLRRVRLSNAIRETAVYVAETGFFAAPDGPHR